MSHKMSDKMDMSLDDIIKLDESKGRGGIRRDKERDGKSRNERNIGVNKGGVDRRRNRGLFTQQSREVPDVWKHDLYEESSEPVRRRTEVGTSRGDSSGKLLISNLDFGVNDTDMKELFSEFGAVIKTTVHFDRSGRSLGTAEVIFREHADAVRAMKQYNNVPLDGRPMNIQLVGGSPSGDRSTRNEGTSNRYGSSRFPSRSRDNSTKFRGGRGRGREKKETPTLAELDAQLDAYNARMDTA